MRPTLLTAAALGALLTAGPARADEVPQEYREAVARGLAWLAKQQNRDGHWEAQGGQYAISMTGLAATALLMEGSTVREGKYQDNLRRAADYLLSKQQANGLFGNPNNPGEAGRYTFGHAFSMQFLSLVYGDEEDGARRKKIGDALERAAKLSREMQTSRGGWGYVSAKDANNFDEGCCTNTQLRALIAVRASGVRVPPEAIRDGFKYLKDATNAQGGIIYSLSAGAGGEGRPALTAGALDCALAAGMHDDELVKKWFKFCNERLPLPGGNARFGYDEYTAYVYAPAVYRLGDGGWAKLFPNDKQDAALTWTKYRKALFDHIAKSQGNDGSWTGGQIGPVFISAVYLQVLQLDKAALPLTPR
jgi:hypothetical protein